MCCMIRSLDFLKLSSSLKQIDSKSESTLRVGDISNSTSSRFSSTSNVNNTNKKNISVYTAGRFEMLDGPYTVNSLHNCFFATIFIIKICRTVVIDPRGSDCWCVANIIQVVRVK